MRAWCFVLLTACGPATPAAPVAATPEPVAAPAPEPAPEPAAAPVAVDIGEPMTDAQRTTIAPLLAAYGSGWSLERLEADHAITVLETDTELVLTFVARDDTGLSWAQRLSRTSGLSGTGAALPDGPAPTPDQVAAAERVVRALGTVWLSRDGESETRPVDASAGVSALIGAPTAARLRGGRAVFYATSEYGDVRAAVVDLEAQRLLAVTAYPFPSRTDELVPQSDVDAIDEAMRLHGDFEVYGDVRAGLVALAALGSVSLRPRSPGVYSVRIEPRGGGHRLSFDVDLATRTLSGVAAGHVTHATPGE